MAKLHPNLLIDHVDIINLTSRIVLYIVLAINLTIFKRLKERGISNYDNFKIVILILASYWFHFIRVHDNNIFILTLHLTLSSLGIRQ